MNGQSDPHPPTSLSRPRDSPCRCPSCCDSGEFRRRAAHCRGPLAPALPPIRPDSPLSASTARSQPHPVARVSGGASPVRLQLVHVRCMSGSDSACAYDRWALPEHRCHWKVVTLNTTVAMLLGPLAGQRYGPDMTLREALDGRGEPYRTLLREATAALLNAYYNAPGSPFLYPTIASVIDHLNGALLSSSQHMLIEGARFRRANTGGGGPAGWTKLPCNFTPCAATNTTTG